MKPLTKKQAIAEIEKSICFYTDMYKLAETLVEKCMFSESVNTLKYSLKIINAINKI